MQEAITRELTVEASAANTSQVIDFVTSAASEAGGSPKLCAQLAVVVDEIYANIASYAYAPGTGQATVRTTVDKGQQQVTLVFMDRGTPFNYLEVAAPDTTLPVEERSIGGLGILLVKEIADDLGYAREEGCNILTVRKRFV